ncbi:MAG TPA: VWA domain-containing protein [Pyrinomonadaceae bacterium]|nr:VWA domain-containing protein [Pyrinomonadaceae bacterium]
MILRTAILALVLVSLALSSTLLAQDTKPAGKTVELRMIVTDSEKKSVDKIQKEDVHVIEDKAEQTVLSVERDDRPIDLVLAIDSSGSVRSLFPTVLESGRVLIINRRPEDEILVERFIGSEKIESMQEFTSDGKLLLTAIDKFFIEKGQSAVIDALYVAANAFAKFNKTSKERRKVVVIITDGEDRNSFYKQEQLVKFLHQTGVQVFALGLVTELDKEAGLIRLSPRDKAEKLLKTVTSETGGRVFFPGNKTELIDSLQQLITDLRGQFRITYQPSREKKGFRKVEVKLASPNGEKRNAIVPRG